MRRARRAPAAACVRCAPAGRASVLARSLGWMDGAERHSLLANSDRQDSDHLGSTVTTPVDPQPAHHPEPLAVPQRSRSTEELIRALHARGFHAVERTSCVDGAEKLRFSAVDRETLDREIGGDHATVTAAEPEPDQDGDGNAPTPVEFRFSRCTTEFYHGTSLAAALKIQDEGFRVDLAGSNAGKMLGPGLYCTTTLEKAVNCE